MSTRMAAERASPRPTGASDHGRGLGRGCASIVGWVRGNHAFGAGCCDSGTRGDTGGAAGPAYAMRQTTFREGPP